MIHPSLAAADLRRPDDAPGIPCALFFEGRVSQQLGRSPRRGNAKLCGSHNPKMNHAAWEAALQESVVDLVAGSNQKK
jgi:hypothetical protein